MARNSKDTLEVFGIRGRWGSNAPFACPPDQCIEALNVDWFRSTLGRKRNGASNVSLTGGTAQTGVISFLFSHVPSDNQAARELWSVDDAATPRFKRLAASTNWADVTLKDNVSTRPMDMNACSFNGKLYFFYDTAVNRLHCWDPTDATVRRTGLALPAAATVANTGGGAYAATIRYYKVAYAVLDGAGVIRYRSNLSAAVSFTPSGAGTAARVTKPASVSESETHWLLYASADGANYVKIATTVVGTTTFDDSTAPAAYTGTAAPDPNAFTPAPSAKFGVADDKYIVIGGAWETTTGDAMAPSTRRAWWSSALGSTDEGDDERISNTSAIKSYTDFSESLVGGAVPQQGSILMFSYNSQWKMVGTGVAVAPYVQFRVTGGRGCIDHKTIIAGEDENGAPCTYWMSPQGPCRAGVGGQYSLLEDINDIWDLVNLDATNIAGHGVYHRDKHQIWWWISVSGGNDPSVKIVFDTRLGRVVEAGLIRKGFSKHDGASAAARCSTMHSNTIAASMSRDLKPYIGKSTTTAIWKCDTGTDDAGTAFQSYITSRPFTPTGLGVLFGTLKDATLVAGAADNIRVALTVIKNVGERSRYFYASLAAKGDATKVFPNFIGSGLADTQCVQYQLGDEAAISNNWNLDALSVPFTEMGEN